MFESTKAFQRRRVGIILPPRRDDVNSLSFFFVSISRVSLGSEGYLRPFPRG